MFAVGVAVGELHIFFPKIKLQLHQGGVLNERRSEVADFTAEPSAKLLQGQSVGAGVIGINQIANGLGLGQVTLAVKEGPLGKLSRQGRATAGVDQALHETLDDKGAAVNVTFHNIFSSEASRAFKRKEQGFVKQFVACIKVAQSGFSRGAFGQTSSAKRVCRGPSVRATDANYGHAASSCGGRKCTNRGAVKGVCGHGGKLALHPY